jgi:chromosome segregation ATPase
MGLRDDYQEKIEAQIKEWAEKIKELKDKASKAKAGAREELQKQIDTLRDRQEAAQKKLKEIKEASGEAWQELKKGLEKSVDDLKEAWGAVVSKFRK